MDKKEKRTKSQAHLEHSQTSKNVELLWFSENFILDFWLDSEYAYENLSIKKSPSLVVF